MSNLLPVRLVERPWGRTKLPRPFVAPAGQRIGEAWFEPFRGFASLLVKYIFTSEALSVQVHPSDAQVPGQGKDECWLILDAEPGARIGIGFREAVDSEAVRAAALDGSIETMLAWHAAKPGDFIYVPAGTVHAIGAGLSLIEVQQSSDTTYRLYDYGRDRPLHLDEALAVAIRAPHGAEHRRHVAGGTSEVLAEGPRFRLDRIVGNNTDDAARRYNGRPLLAIPLHGSVRIEGEEASPGSCALAPSLTAIDFASGGICLIAQPCM